MNNWKDDIVVTVINPHDKGGQHVGWTASIIRVVHTPTGIVAECGYERSQFKNREVAMSMIQWALVNMNFSSEYTKQLAFCLQEVYNYRLYWERVMYKVIYTVKDNNGFLVDKSKKFERTQEALAFILSLQGKTIGKPTLDTVER